MLALAIDGLLPAVQQHGKSVVAKGPISIPQKLQRVHEPIRNPCSSVEIRCFYEAPDFFVCRILSLCYGLGTVVFEKETWQPYLAKYP